MSNNTNWHWLINFFNNSTRTSNKKMHQLASDHVSKLRQVAPRDAEIQFLLDFLEPFFSAFIVQYEKSTDDRAVYRDLTAQFTTLLTDITSKQLHIWDLQIQLAYGRNSRQYTVLFPQGRAPFQTGGYEPRIRAVKALGRALQNDPQLAALGQDILVLGQQLEDLRNSQQGIEYDFSSNSSQLSRKREELAEALFGVFGRLKFHYYKELDTVENFYELKYFRSSSSVGVEEEESPIMELRLSPNSQQTFFAGQIEGGEIIRLVNLEGGDIQYYSLVTATDNPDHKLNLFSGQNMDYSIPLDHRILVLENTNSTEVKLSIELI